MSSFAECGGFHYKRPPLCVCVCNAHRPHCPWLGSIFPNSLDSNKRFYFLGHNASHLAPLYSESQMESQMESQIQECLQIQFFSHHLVFISIVFLQNKKTQKKMKFPEMDTYPGEGHIDRFIVCTIKSCHVSFSKPCAHLGDFSFFCFFLKLPENKLAKRINEINRKPELVRTQDSPMRF